MGDSTRINRLIEGAVEQLEAADRLDPLADRFGEAAGKLLGGAERRTLLSGTQVGHSLHPPLTDLPVGLLTAASVFDLLPGRTSTRLATLLVAAGLLTTVPTAVTGANDWIDTHGGPRRVGLAHAAGNGAASLLYGLSLLSRLRGRTFKARLLGWVGLVFLHAAGFLGSHLAYRRGVGVDHTVFLDLPGTWTPTGTALDDLPEQQLTKSRVGEVDVVLYRANGVIHALADRCTHAGGPLSGGHVHEHDGDVEISCPWHHSTFRAADGGVVRGPATAPQPTLEARVSNGIVEVRATS